MRFTTEELAKAAGTTVRGIRIWDNHNLFGSIGRDEYGARIFDDSHVRRGKIINAAQMAGMTLREIHGAHETTLANKITEARGFMDTALDLINLEFDL